MSDYEIARAEQYEDARAAGRTVSDETIMAEIRAARAEGDPDRLNAAYDALDAAGMERIHRYAQRDAAGRTEPEDDLICGVVGCNGLDCTCPIGNPGAVER